MPRSEALTITVRLTDYRVDLPQPCHPTGCFATPSPAFANMRIIVLERKMWCQNVSAITHATQRHSKYHLILVMIPKGGEAIRDIEAFYLHCNFTDPFYLKKFAKKVWKSFFSQIWFQGQQFCEAHCRHDVQCLLAMPASTGCYRAMRPNQLELCLVCKPYETLAAAGDQWKALSNWAGLQLHQPCGHHELCTAIRRCATCTLAFF